MSNTPGRAAKVVLVYFLGGCSYSEIAALRFLGKQTGNVTIFILQTHVLKSDVRRKRKLWNFDILKLPDPVIIQCF